LMENAFHAAMLDAGDRGARVRVVTRQIGSVTRIEIRDTGGGVIPEDRQRIFEPLVTTKKGGQGGRAAPGSGCPSRGATPSTCTARWGSTRRRPRRASTWTSWHGGKANERQANQAGPHRGGRRDERRGGGR